MDINKAYQRARQTRAWIKKDITQISYHTQNAYPLEALYNGLLVKLA